MKQCVHFVGIGGIGMSGLARILLEKGYQVSGSDLVDSSLLKNLEALGGKISIGHSEMNVPERATVIYSTDIKDSNQEIAVALRRKQDLKHRSDLLNTILKDRTSLLVAGTHGKTTTTSLLTHLLIHAGFDPGFAIGGILPSVGVNSSDGKGNYFVAEADESDGSFLKYHPFGAILTNIDLDHMDHYQNEEALLTSFKQFAFQVVNQGCLLYCGDDHRLVSLGLSGVSYGFGENCTVRGSRFRQKGWNIMFDIADGERTYTDIEIPFPGYHTALNALAVFAMGIRLGIPEDIIKEAFRTFCGVKRRAEIKGEERHVTVIDDYGHHPSEISTTLKGLKKAFPKRRLITIFQPHRFTRVRDCLKEFGTCFEHSDVVIVTDIYSAGESPIPGVHAKAVIDEVASHFTGNPHYISNESLLQETLQILRPYDIVVTMGAGDITRFGMELLTEIKKKPLTKLKLAGIYGGKSSEHEISIRSAKNVFSSIDSSIFDLQLFYIAKDGSWREGASNTSPHDLEFVQKLSCCDCAVPILHGQNGEDGSLQGFLQILGIPYTGCSVLSSAISMDKAMTKRLAEYAGLAVAPFVTLNEFTWEWERDQAFKLIHDSLIYPLYVKPVHLGSTIGVRKVVNPKELVQAIEAAFQLDGEILIENEIRGREIEFAVYGNGELHVFPPGEIKSQGGTYGYQEKYFSSTMETTPHAELTQEEIERGCAFAKRAYAAAGCDGFARVDCFLKSDGQFILNEINPIPGFTSTSLYPQICRENGLPEKEFWTHLILSAMERGRQQDRKRL